MIAASFGFSKSQANKWYKILRPLVFDTLKTLHLLPTKEGHKVIQILTKLNKTSVFKILRKDLLSDQDIQQDFYDGKKSPHD